MIEKLKKYEAIVASGEIGADTRNEVAVLLGKAAKTIEGNNAEVDRWWKQALEEDAAANALREENTNLRELIGELADGLSRVMKVSKWCDCCCDDCEEQNNCNSQKMRELIAKAREVAK